MARFVSTAFTTLLVAACVAACSSGSPRYSCDSTGCYYCDDHGCTPTTDTAPSQPARDAKASDGGPDAFGIEDAAASPETGAADASGSPGRCSVANDCAASQRCSEGYCRFTCASDADCRRIDARIGRCASDGVCRS